MKEKKKRRYLTVPLTLTENREKHNMGLVLGYIRLCKNKDGEANPSHETIAKAVGISEKTVRRQLAKAKEEGWIDWSSGKGSHESNFYSFPASSDWLDEETYLVDQTACLKGQNDNNLGKSSLVIAKTDEPSPIGQEESVILEPSSVKAISFIGQNDTPHWSQLRPTNIYNIYKKENREEEPIQENPVSVKETEKEEKNSMTDIPVKKPPIQYELLTRFEELFLQTYNEPYIPNKGKDLTLISGLLKYFSPEQLQGKMEQAFIQLKPKDGKVTIPYFKACINSLSDASPQSDHPTPQSDKSYKIGKDEKGWFFKVLSTGCTYTLKQAKLPYSKDSTMVNTWEELCYFDNGKLQSRSVEYLQDKLQDCEYMLAKITYKVQSKDDEDLLQEEDIKQRVKLWQELKEEVEEAIELKGKANL